MEPLTLSAVHPILINGSTEINTPARAAGKSTGKGYHYSILNYHVRILFLSNMYLKNFVTIR